MAARETEDVTAGGRPTAFGSESSPFARLEAESAAAALGTAGPAAVAPPPVAPAPIREAPPVEVVAPAYVEEPDRRGRDPARAASSPGPPIGRRTKGPGATTRTSSARSTA